MRGVAGSLLLLPLLGACAVAPPGPVAALRRPSVDQHLPAYERHAFEPFSRTAAIAVALREWRAFGMVVNDDPPGPGLPPELRPDRQPGLWQRVADYWWSSQDYGASQGEWSSLYNESGTPYVNDAPAWSAAFISYVMRVAGAGAGFPYTPLHADYINAAARGEGALQAERPETYAPQPGDLICYGRRSATALRFDDLPTTRFFGHCDLVAVAVPGQLSVIGGNVSAAVTMKHVPTTAQGTLAGPDGLNVDARYPWFVVLRVKYAG